MITKIFHQTPTLVIALVGILITSVFLLTIPYGMNFTISCIISLVSIPFYTLILFGLKRKSYRLIIGVFVVVTFLLFFQSPEMESIVMADKLSNPGIVYSPVQTFLLKFNFFLMGLSVPMTFIGIVNK